MSISGSDRECLITTVKRCWDPVLLLSVRGQENGSVCEMINNWYDKARNYLLKDAMYSEHLVVSNFCTSIKCTHFFEM